MAIHLAAPDQIQETLFDGRGGKLKAVGCQVAVGARAAVAAEAGQLPIEERMRAARDGIAWVRAAIEWTPRRPLGVSVLRSRHCPVRWVDEEESQDHERTRQHETRRMHFQHLYLRSGK